MISNLVHPGKQCDHLPMTPYRSLLRWLGGLLGLAGAAAGVGALALPWARYHVRADVALAGAPVDTVPGAWIFQPGRLPYAPLYLLLLVLTIALAATAGLGERRQRPVAATLALLLGVLAGVLGWVIGQRIGVTEGTAQAAGFAAVQVRASLAPGAPLGMLAPVLIGLAGALLSRAAADLPAVARPADSDVARRTP